MRARVCLSSTANPVHPIGMIWKEAGCRSFEDVVGEAAKPQVLFVYYTYTQQSLRVVEAMAEVLRDRGCEVRQAGIEVTDKRWAERTGEIRIPEEAQHGDYDLVCVGSPTWFFKPSVPIRSFLESESAHRILEGKRFAAFVVCRRYWSINLRAVKKLGAKQGGEYVGGLHLSFAGGQIRSLLSLISYFGKGENRERYLGVRIPPSLLKPDYVEQARAFADELADRMRTNGQPSVAAHEIALHATTPD